MSACQLRGLALCSCCLLILRAADAVPLRMDEESYTARVFADVPQAEAAGLAAAEDPDRGRCLVVGPWRQGRWRAAMQYGEKLPTTSGTISGWYRTEGLATGQAAVFAEFFRGDRRIRLESFPLEASDGWGEFSVVVRYGPPAAETMSPGFGLQAHTEGRVWFAGLQVTAEVPPLVLPAELPAVTRPNPPGAFAPGRFLRVEEAGGTWWLVKPDGRPFYSIATDGPGFDREDPELRDGREMLAFLRRHGFNSLAGWTNVWRWGRLNDRLIEEGGEAMPIFWSLQTSAPGRWDQLVDAHGRTTGDDHAFPDPFDPRFEQQYRKAVADRMYLVRDRPWFAGWFADNEVSHRELYRHVWSPHCAAALGDWLAGRYGTINALNTAWGSEYESFEGLIAAKTDAAVPEGRMYEDLLAFERVIVKRYIDITLRCIRAEDPDHLIFSNRFMMGDVEHWPKLLDLYTAYDAIACNLYPANRGPGLSESEKAVFAMVHERTGLPLMVTEWSIPAIDSGLYDGEQLDWSWATVAATQEERARQAAVCSIDFYNMPFIVGAHWFTWGDFDSERRQANRGLRKANGEPWARLLEKLAEAHRAIAAAQE